MDLDFYKIKFCFIWAYQKTIKIFRTFCLFGIPFSLYMLTTEPMNFILNSLARASIKIILVSLLCTYIFAYINYEDLSSKH